MAQTTTEPVLGEGTKQSWSAAVYDDVTELYAESLTRGATVPLTTNAPATPVANTLYADTFLKGAARVEQQDTPYTLMYDLNVSSITDTGTGEVTVNWATNISVLDADYVAVTGCLDDYPKFICMPSDNNAYQAVWVYAIDGTTKTDGHIHLAVFGRQS